MAASSQVTCCAGRVRGCRARIARLGEGERAGHLGGGGSADGPCRGLPSPPRRRVRGSRARGGLALALAMPQSGRGGVRGHAAKSTPASAAAFAAPARCLLRAEQHARIPVVTPVTVIVFKGCPEPVDLRGAGGRLKCWLSLAGLW